MTSTRTKPTVVPFTHTATGTGVAQRVTVGGDAGHVVDVDTHPAFGGQDAAPSPLSYVLAALSSCNQITASIVAGELGVALGAWSFEVGGDLDTAVLVSGADGNANFDSVRLVVRVQTDATPEQFDRLVAETERRCPVTQLFRRSGLVYESTWTATPLAG
ncbi:OsmC family peroxiredoxin [Modestobacter sp. I12A-02628]|uniref:OsmC family protein n=1 Tax=Goekera deserti TaxID=2497753 RepID=A0A7K3W9F1_9ACTN|nr:OsmC family protein [Goekera deserti]MPQ98790.1 OsmC family peroxiredoxin [Goekera deserti]NDI49712.1 OsmC family peroxiredoxin [Goekera deserti]NEL53095.1 OsmC family protein [Goekera deserti]